MVMWISFSVSYDKHIIVIIKWCTEHIFTNICISNITNITGLCRPMCGLAGPSWWWTRPGFRTRRAAAGSRGRRSTTCVTTTPRSASSCTSTTWPSHSSRTATLRSVRQPSWVYCSTLLVLPVHTQCNDKTVSVLHNFSAISRSSQCSTTGVPKAMVCAILSLGLCI